MASIGWIDFSRNDRDRVGSVLDLLRPEGMVDELGMGTIRDALANWGIYQIEQKEIPIYFLPHPNAHYNSESRKKKWQFCFPESIDPPLHVECFNN